MSPATDQSPRRCIEENSDWAHVCNTLCLLHCIIQSIGLLGCGNILLLPPSKFYWQSTWPWEVYKESPSKGQILHKMASLQQIYNVLHICDLKHYTVAIEAERSKIRHAAGLWRNTLKKWAPDSCWLELEVSFQKSCMTGVTEARKSNCRGPCQVSTIFSNRAVAWSNCYEISAWNLCAWIQFAPASLHRPWSPAGIKSLQESPVLLPSSGSTDGIPAHLWDLHPVCSKP